MPFDPSTYTFPSHKLRRPEHGKRAAVLVSCGSLNPVHAAHVDMLHAAKSAVEGSLSTSPSFSVVGAFVSPVNDAYGKAGLAPFPVRLEACRIAVSDDPFVAVDDWEGRQDAYVRTFYVLEHIHKHVTAWLDASATAEQAAGVGAVDAPESPEGLQATRPRPLTVFFVCGGDLFETFYRPDCWNLALLRKIFDNFALAVATRTGSKDPRDVVAAHAAPLTNRSEPNESLDLKPYASSIVVFEMPPNETSSTCIRSLLAAGQEVPSTMLRPEVAAYLQSAGAYVPT